MAERYHVLPWSKYSQFTWKTKWKSYRILNDGKNVLTRERVCQSAVESAVSRQVRRQLRIEHVEDFECKSRRNKIFISPEPAVWRSDGSISMSRGPYTCIVFDRLVSNWCVLMYVKTQSRKTWLSSVTWCGATAIVSKSPSCTDKCIVKSTLNYKAWWLRKTRRWIKTKHYHSWPRCPFESSKHQSLFKVLSDVSPLSRRHHEQLSHPVLLSLHRVVKILGYSPLYWLLLADLR